MVERATSALAALVDMSSPVGEEEMHIECTYYPHINHNKKHNTNIFKVKFFVVLFQLDILRVSVPNI